MYPLIWRGDHCSSFMSGSMRHRKRGGLVSVAWSAFLALFGLIVCLKPYILTVLRGIALDFTTDGGFADIYKLSNYFL